MITLPPTVARCVCCFWRSDSSQNSGALRKRLAGCAPHLKPLEMTVWHTGFTRSTGSLLRGALVLTTTGLAPASRRWLIKAHHAVLRPGSRTGRDSPAPWPKVMPQGGPRRSPGRGRAPRLWTTGSAVNRGRRHPAGRRCLLGSVRQHLQQSARCAARSVQLPAEPVQRLQQPQKVRLKCLSSR